MSLINKLTTIIPINAIPALPGWKHIGKVLGLLCLCSLVLIGCGGPRDQGSSPSPTTAGSNRITLGTTAKIRTLDPADAYEVFAGNILYNLGDRLYTYEPGTTNLKPQLATELPRISSDGLVYTIPLRQGVAFHDGTPFNAEAMAFSLQRFIENGGRPAFLLADTIESVKPAGDDALTVRLKQPFGPFPSLLAFSGACAVSPKAYQIGSGKFQPTTFVGTGPYKLAQYGSDSVRLDTFEQYWGDKPANQGIDIRTFSSSANLFNAFRTKAVDVAYQSLDPNQTKTLVQGGQRGWQVIEGPGNVVSYLALNVKAQPLDNVAVRQAVAAMINRPLLQQRVFQGQADPLYSLIPTVFDVNKPVFKDQYGDGNAAVVQALLSKAGYSPAKPLKLNLWYRSNIPSDSPVATTLKAFAQQELGGAVQVELSSVESATAYQNRSKGIYPIFLSDWYGDFFDPDGYIQPFLACAKGSVATGCQEGASQSQGSFYYSDRANQLIDQERQEQNPEKRKQIFVQIQDLLAEDVPFVPLWQNKDYAFAQQGIDGVRLEPAQQFLFGPIKKS